MDKASTSQHLYSDPWLLAARNASYSVSPTAVRSEHTAGSEQLSGECERSCVPTQVSLRQAFVCVLPLKCTALPSRSVVSADQSACLPTFRRNATMSAGGVSFLSCISPCLASDTNVLNTCVWERRARQLIRLW